jgi:hypothetical protein
MTTTIGPALGHGPWTQQGTGVAPGYDAIDVRRLLQGVAPEGVLSSGGFAVTQRAAGANLSVDIAASTGEGARVQGDAVTLQGLYYVAPHSAVINEAISTAHATLPRNDLVVLEIKDTTHDASGSNLAQTRVVTGTATAGAAQTDALGVNGTPALPASAIPLAVVNVPALDTAIATSQVDDRRPSGARFGGTKTIIPTEETRSNTAYGLLTTPDSATVSILAGDLIEVDYWALWKASVQNSARAAVFIGANQLQGAVDNLAGIIGQIQTVVYPPSVGSVGFFNPLVSYPAGLWTLDQSQTLPALPTTGLATGLSSTTAGVGVNGGPASGGPLKIFGLAAGTYTISVQFKSTSGTINVKNRYLYVSVKSFG